MNSEDKAAIERIRRYYGYGRLKEDCPAVYGLPHQMALREISGDIWVVTEQYFRDNPPHEEQPIGDALGGVAKKNGEDSWVIPEDYYRPDSRKLHVRLEDGEYLLNLGDGLSVELKTLGDLRKIQRAIGFGYEEKT